MSIVKRVSAPVRSAAAGCSSADVLESRTRDAEGASQSLTGLAERNGWSGGQSMFPIASGVSPWDKTSALTGVLLRVAGQLSYWLLTDAPPFQGDPDGAGHPTAGQQDRWMAAADLAAGLAASFSGTYRAGEGGSPLLEYTPQNLSAVRGLLDTARKDICAPLQKPSEAMCCLLRWCESVVGYVSAIEPGEEGPSTPPSTEHAGTLTVRRPPARSRSVSPSASPRTMQRLGTTHRSASLQPEPSPQPGRGHRKSLVDVFAVSSAVAEPAEQEAAAGAAELEAASVAVAAGSNAGEAQHAATAAEVKPAAPARKQAGAAAVHSDVAAAPAKPAGQAGTPEDNNNSGVIEGAAADAGPERGGCSRGGGGRLVGQQPPADTSGGRRVADGSASGAIPLLTQREAPVVETDRSAPHTPASQASTPGFPNYRRDPASSSGQWPRWAVPFPAGVRAGSSPAPSPAATCPGRPPRRPVPGTPPTSNASERSARSPAPPTAPFGGDDPRWREYFAERAGARGHITRGQMHEIYAELDSFGVPPKQRARRLDDTLNKYCCSAGRDIVTLEEFCLVMSKVAGM